MVYWYYCSCIVMWYILGLWVQSFFVHLFLLIIITAVILMQYSVLFSITQFCSAFSDSELISSLSAELADQFWSALSNAEWGHCRVHFQPKWLGKEEFEFWSALIRKILWPLSADQNMWGTDKTSIFQISKTGQIVCATVCEILWISLRRKLGCIRVNKAIKTSLHRDQMVQ